MAEFDDLRYYENKFPKAGDGVMMIVTDIKPEAAYVELLEYNNCQGMIPISQLTKRRFRSINKLIRVGKQECVMVIRTDENKGYIDLSKAVVTTEDIKACEERYSRNKAVQTIVRQVAKECGITVLELNQKVTWPLAQSFGDAYHAFRQMAVSPQMLDNVVLPENVKTMLLADIRRRLAPPQIRIRATVDVQSFLHNGLEVVQRCLRAGRDLTFTHELHECKAEIRLAATPSYVITATCTEKQIGLDHVAAMVKAIGAAVEKEEDTTFKCSQVPTMVGYDEEKEKKDDEEDSDAEDMSDEETEDEDAAGMGEVDEEAIENFKKQQQSNDSDDE